MPTRYGSPDATTRTLPHRQPPVNLSMLRLLEHEAVGVATTRSTVARRHLRCHPVLEDRHPAAGRIPRQRRESWTARALLARMLRCIAWSSPICWSGTEARGDIACRRA